MEWLSHFILPIILWSIFISMGWRNCGSERLKNDPRSHVKWVIKFRSESRIIETESLYCFQSPLCPLSRKESCMYRLSYSFLLLLNPINSKKHPRALCRIFQRAMHWFSKHGKTCYQTIWRKKNRDTYLIIGRKNFPQQIFPRNKVRKINYLLNEQAIISLASFMYCVLHWITFQNLKYPEAQCKV